VPCKLALKVRANLTFCSLHSGAFSGVKMGCFFASFANNE
jgi:hypothetical protein